MKEKHTNDLRAVTRNGVVVAIERRWRVATEMSYRGLAKRNDDDFSDSSPYITEGLWLIARSEWRPIPSVESSA